MTDSYYNGVRVSVGEKIAMQWGFVAPKEQTLEEKKIAYLQQQVSNLQVALNVANGYALRQMRMIEDLESCMEWEWFLSS